MKGSKPTTMKAITRQNVGALQAAIFGALVDVGRQYGVRFEQEGRGRFTPTELRLKIVATLTDTSSAPVAVAPHAAKFPPGLPVTDADIGKTIRYGNGEFRIDGYTAPSGRSRKTVLLTKTSDGSTGYKDTPEIVAGMLGRDPNADKPIAASFASKQPHTTLWLDLEFPADKEPKQLLADLKAAGWTESDDFGGRLPPLMGRQKVTVGAKGSNMFHGWTDAERKANMTAVRAVLKRHGLTDVPHKRLTLADML